MFRIHGQETAVRLIEQGLREGRLHHAYLLVGPPHVGKSTLALQLAQAVNCTGQDPPCHQCAACERIAKGIHADVRTLGLTTDEEGTSRTLIGIEAVRDLHHTAHLPPYEGRCHVFIVQEAERLSQDAANAMLKLLEEPPPNVLLVLLASDPEALPPTVVSRCLRLELRPLPMQRVAALLRDEYHAAPEQAEELARLSRGCLGWAVEAVQGGGPMASMHQALERIAHASQGALDVRLAYADELARRFQRDRASAREELHGWLRWWRDVLLISEGCPEEVSHAAWRDTLERTARGLSPARIVQWVHRILETLDALDRNANPRLALDVMMLELPEAATSAVESG